MSFTTRVLATLLATLSLSLNCVAATFPDYPLRSITEYAVSVTQSGFALAAHPVEDAREQKTYFNTEFAPKGFLPVFIVMQNHSSTDSFLLRKNDIAYGAAADLG